MENENEKIEAPLHDVKKFGTATLGERGQVVIPAEIREELDLEQGEQFMVLLINDSVVFIPGDKFEEMVSQLDQKVTKLKQFKEEK